jgi:hypothetical protein
VAWRKRKLFRRSGTQENFGLCKEVTAIRMRKIPEGNSGIRERGSKQQLRQRKTTTTGNGIRGRSRRQELCMRSQKTLYETLGQNYKLEVMK